MGRLAANDSHIKQRVMERFGVTISNSDLRILKRLIESYEVMPVWICNNSGRSFHAYSYKDCDMVFLYDWLGGGILTVYRVGWFDNTDTKHWKLKRRTPKTKEYKHRKRRGANEDKRHKNRKKESKNNE